MQDVNPLLLGALIGVLLTIGLTASSQRPTIVIAGPESRGDGGGCGAALIGLLIFAFLAILVATA